MIKISTRSGSTVYLAPEAIASVEESYMGDRGLTTVIRTFDGQRFEVGDYADRIAKQVEQARAALARPEPTP